MMSMFDFQDGAWQDGEKPNSAMQLKVSTKSCGEEDAGRPRYTIRARQPSWLGAADAEQRLRLLGFSSPAADNGSLWPAAAELRGLGGWRYEPGQGITCSGTGAGPTADRQGEVMDAKQNCVNTVQSERSRTSVYRCISLRFSDTRQLSSRQLKK